MRNAGSTIMASSAYCTAHSCLIKSIIGRQDICHKLFLAMLVDLAISYQLPCAMGYSVMLYEVLAFIACSVHTGRQSAPFRPHSNYAAETSICCAHLTR